MPVFRCAEWWHFTLEGEPFPRQRFDFPIAAERSASAGKGKLGPGPAQPVPEARYVLIEWSDEAEIRGDIVAKIFPQNGQLRRKIALTVQKRQH